jgi:hypothetical protein
METLGTLILNTKKKFLIFSYKKKKITSQDFKMKSCSIASIPAIVLAIPAIVHPIMEFKTSQLNLQQENHNGSEVVRKREQPPQLAEV